MIHIYTGDGKGKTTAALGLLVRACGAGKRAIFCQFLKDGTSCELNTLPCLKAAEVMRSEGVFGFFPELSEEEKARVAKAQRELAISAFRTAAEVDIAVFDEFLWLVHFGIICEAEALELIKSVPQKTELVLTGGIAGEALISVADYVTEMKKIKHPFDTGAPAREGIEF